MNIFDVLCAKLTPLDLRRGWMVVSEKEWNEYIHVLDPQVKATIYIDNDNIVEYFASHSPFGGARSSHSPFYKGCQLRVL